MSFCFVDRIFSIDGKKRAFGVKNVTKTEGFFYTLPNGETVLSPAVVTEALAQLGSWLQVYSSDFTKRPVLLADEYSTYEGYAFVGDQIELHVELLDQDDEVIVTKSHAEICGRRIVTINNCRSYLLPIEEFDHRENTIRQFNNLYRPDTENVFIPAHSLPRSNEILSSTQLSRLDFIDGIIEHTPGKRVIGLKNFSSCEPYFATHFPFKPVVPGVLLMTLIGEFSQLLLQNDLEKPDITKFLSPTFIRNARFRKFVEPGDRCLVNLEVIDQNISAPDAEWCIKAVLEANGKKVMQGEMGFKQVQMA